MGNGQWAMGNGYGYGRGGSMRDMCASDSHSVVRGPTLASTFC